MKHTFEMLKQIVCFILHFIQNSHTHFANINFNTTKSIRQPATGY